MSINLEKYMSEAISEDLGLEYSEAKKKNFEEYDVLDVVGDILSETYDVHVSQFRSLRDKINKFIDKQLTEAIEKYQAKVTELRMRIRSIENKDDKEALQRKIEEFNSYGKEKLEDIIENMLEDQKAKDMSFVDFFLQQ